MKVSVCLSELEFVFDWVRDKNKRVCACVIQLCFCVTGQVFQGVLLYVLAGECVCNLHKVSKREIDSIRKSQREKGKGAKELSHSQIAERFRSDRFQNFFRDVCSKFEIK